MKIKTLEKYSLYISQSVLTQFSNVQEGVRALWTGIGPNVARNAIINAAELASYDQVKQVNSICNNLMPFPQLHRILCTISNFTIQCRQF
jgi:hypothetical protein